MVGAVEGDHDREQARADSPARTLFVERHPGGSDEEGDGPERDVLWCAVGQRMVEHGLGEEHGSAKDAHQPAVSHEADQPRSTEGGSKDEEYQCDVPGQDGIKC